MKLKDKVCIVTGGAMGNGLGIVKVFLDYGAKVIILDYSDEVYSTIDRLKSVNLSGYKVDIRDKEEVNSIVSEIIRDFGRIDVVVNNAEFVTKKDENSTSTSNPPAETEFVPIPEGIEGDLPWN